MSLKLLFSGDVSFTGGYSAAVKAKDEIFSAEMLELFSQSDHVVLNFEGPATTKENVLRQDVYVVSPPESVRYLTQRRADVFNLANNHSFDSDVAGYLETASLIDANGALRFGAGQTLAEASQILFLKSQGVRVALIGVCHREGLIATPNSPGIFCDENLMLASRISEAKSQADWVILNYHGGEEYTTVPMPRRRRLLHSLLELGADFIVAHHSHVVQGYEKVGPKMIFYSLGNFVFDIPSHKNRAFTREGMLLQLSLEKNSYSFEPTGTKMDLDKGNVALAKVPEGFKDLANYDYELAWSADAHRVFFRSSAREATRESAAPAKSSSKLAKLSRPQTYLRLYHLLKAKNTRPVFLSALKFELLKRLGWGRSKNV